MSKDLLRFERLSSPVPPAFASMTFPAYTHLLSLEKGRRHQGMALLPVITPVAVAAFVGLEAAGLAIAELPDEKPQEAEMLSLFVRPTMRGFGIGTGLLQAMDKELEALRCTRAHGVYMTGQIAQEPFERVLEKAGWAKPETRMLSLRVNLPDFEKAPWFGRYPLGEGLSVFPWAELTPEERAELWRSQQEKPWIAPNLEPWKHDADGFEPISSLGVRKDGKVVGWVINHAVGEETVRFTCSYLRKDLSRRGKIVPVFTESIRRLFGSKYRVGSFTVPLQHEGMTLFALKHIAPVASFLGETRGTEKALGR